MMELLCRCPVLHEPDGAVGMTLHFQSHTHVLIAGSQKKRRFLGAAGTLPPRSHHCTDILKSEQMPTLLLFA